MRKVACLMMLCGISAICDSEVMTKLIGNWVGTYKGLAVDGTFTKQSFNLSMGRNPGSRCTASGSYKGNGDDELIVTPHALDGNERNRSCAPELYGEFVLDRETNLGAVEFASDNKTLIGGRLNMSRHQ